MTPVVRVSIEAPAGKSVVGGDRLLAPSSPNAEEEFMVAHLRSVETALTETADQECPHLLQLLNLVHYRVMKQASDAVGGSANLDECAALRALSDGAEYTMSQIANTTRTPPPTMTKLINRLVESGMVYRRTDSVDRRRVFVFITPRGHSRFQRLQALIDASVADLSDDLELRELVGELQRRIGVEKENTE
jgi:DNA-binding MarR family transcriptional regulator